MLDFNEHPYDDDDKLKLDNYHKKKWMINFHLTPLQRV